MSGDNYERFNKIRDELQLLRRNSEIFKAKVRARQGFVPAEYDFKTLVEKAREGFK